jgi:hypothetical protein
MKSKTLEKDRQDLITLARQMTPEERLVAYVNHCRQVGRLHQAGVRSRKLGAAARSTIIRKTASRRS